ncbi:MAG: iron-sulfur cluster co-chaperone HscB C-terminal domain-containing protein [Phycisphaerales bacterium]
MSHHAMTNPFAILNLPERFDLEPDQIERAYLMALRSAHPDAGGGDSAHESVHNPGSEPQTDAATLNAARQILLDHEQRASALLRCQGGPSAGELKDLPDGFLMDIMTRRQEIEEAIAHDGDGARSTWETWANQERSAYIAQVNDLFSQSAQDTEILPQIRVVLNAWRYIERLIEQLDPAYDPAKADFSSE